MLTHSLSIWPLDAELDFSDSVPCYESQPMSEADAQEAYAAATFATASLADSWQASPLAYLVSLDRLDEDGIGICQRARRVTP